MGIKQQYEKQEDVPAEYLALYTEQNGKWVLTGVEGMKSQTDIDRIQASLVKERNDHKATKDKYASFADLDVDDVIAKLDRYPELEAAAAGKIDDTKINEMVETRMRTKLAPIEREKSKLQSQLAEAQKTIDTHVQHERTRKIHDAVRESASKSKLRNEALDDVILNAERLFEVTDDGQVVTKDNVGVTPGVGAEVWLTEMQPKRPHWWPDSSGGGARGNNGQGGNTGTNPFHKDTWNVTQQGNLIRENRTRAEQMAKAAGTTIGGARPGGASPDPQRR